MLQLFSSIFEHAAVDNSHHSNNTFSNSATAMAFPSPTSPSCCINHHQLFANRLFAHYALYVPLTNVTKGHLNDEQGRKRLPQQTP